MVHKKIRAMGIYFETSKLNLVYKYIPMLGIGGDFISYRYDANKKKIVIFLCDVSGHGVPAAITASVISMAFSEYFTLAFTSPALALETMQKALINKMGGHFFTGLLASINCEDGEVIIYKCRPPSHYSN
jgi:serine phosphatase RsbU (regulator of sigma subunit)